MTGNTKEYNYIKQITGMQEDTIIRVQKETQKLELMTESAKIQNKLTVIIAINKILISHNQ